MRRHDPVEILDDALRQIGELAVPSNADPGPYLVQAQRLAEDARLRAGRLRPTRASRSQERSPVSR
jgi:hypothetical protein